MYQTGYHATGYYATGYYLPEAAVVISSGGGGSGPGVSAPGDHFNQAPDTRKRKNPYLQQALQEDEEMLLMIKAFVETIQ